jgi:hypothetical protein
VTFSGTSTFEKFLSIDDIITESFERLGLFDYSGNDLRSARRSLNIMFQEWDNRGLHFWEVARTAITLESGKNEYTLFRSPSDGNANGITTTLTSTILSTDTTIPVASVKNMNPTGKIRVNNEVIIYTSISGNNIICEASGRGAAPSGVTNFVDMVSDILEASFRNESDVDTPLSKINRSQYQAFSNKSSTGQPSQYFVQRFIDKVTITLYLTPGDTQAGKFIYFYYVKRIQDAGKYTNEADVVNRFVPCMCAGLTYYISMKKAPQRTQEMKLYYEDELQRALTEDGSPASVYISPKTYYPEI